MKMSKVNTNPVGKRESNEFLTGVLEAHSEIDKSR